MIDPARVTYRDGRAPDALMLSDLARETFVATFGALYPIADLNHYISHTYGRDLQEAELADPENQHRLAFSGDIAIGYARLGAFKLPIEPVGVKVRELHRLYVIADAKGMGVAQKLMDWAFAAARGAGAEAMYLGVYQGNDRAQRFYARQGFEIVGEYAFEVGQTRDPEYIMRASLA